MFWFRLPFIDLPQKNPGISVFAKNFFTQRNGASNRRSGKVSTPIFASSNSYFAYWTRMKRRRAILSLICILSVSSSLAQLDDDDEIIRSYGGKELVLNGLWIGIDGTTATGQG